MLRSILTTILVATSLLLIAGCALPDKGANLLRGPSSDYIDLSLAPGAVCQGMLTDPMPYASFTLEIVGQDKSTGKLTATLEFNRPDGFPTPKITATGWTVFNRAFKHYAVDFAWVNPTNGSYERLHLGAIKDQLVGVKYVVGTVQRADGTYAVESAVGANLVCTIQQNTQGGE